MKRFTAVSLLLVLLAAGGAGLYRFWGYLPERTRGAELAPADTVLFLQMPTLRLSALRATRTELSRIWNEPELQQFLRSSRRPPATVENWVERFQELLRAAPGEAFLAVEIPDGANPRCIAACSFARRGALEKLLNEPRTAFKNAHPAGRSDVVSHGSDSIESFTYEGGELAECFLGHWYFVANDVALLRATLDRYHRNTRAAEDNLAGQPVFQAATAPLGAGLDALAFLRLTPISSRLNTMLSLSGASAAPADPTAPPKEQAIAAGTKIEGQDLRDRFFIYDPGAKAAPALSLRTAALGGPQTALYYAFAPLPDLRVPDSIGAAAAMIPGLAELRSAAAARHIAWSDFEAAFGPETGAFVEWPDDTTIPAALAAMEVRDPVRARRLLDGLLGGQPGALGWSRRDEAGTSIWSAPAAGLALARPAVALTGNLAILSMNPEALNAALARLKPGSANLAAAPAFQSAIRSPQPTGSLGYLETRRIFERSYQILRPFVTMALALSAEGDDGFDMGKFPPAEIISRHLTPSALKETSTSTGTLFESRGTVTFSQCALAGLAAGAFATRNTLAASLPSIAGVARSVSGSAPALTPPAPFPSATPPPPARSNLPMPADSTNDSAPGISASRRDGSK